MGFHDELKQQALEKQSAAQAEAARQAEQFKQQCQIWRSECKERVVRWFDEIGMQPHPSVVLSEVTLEFNYDYGDDDSKDYFMRANWCFEGYQYRSKRIRARASAEKIGVEINIRGYWCQADTREHIAQALLRD